MIPIRKKKIIYKIVYIIMILSVVQGCRCLICDNNGESNPKNNLGQLINSPYDDFAPVIIGDRLVFTSSKEGVSGYIPDDNFYGEDLFIASREDNVWRKALLLDKPATTSTNEGTIGQIALNKNDYTIIARSHAESGFGGSDLYLAKYNGRTFYDFSNLGEKFNTENWESQPTLSSDGNILIFASNRPGGFGGSDLYIAHKNGQTWSEPTNLGTNINTEADEISPHLSIKENTILFYASESGDNNNSDIYYNYLKNDNDWYTKQLLTTDINSGYNDAFPFVTSDASTIYFCSDRPGGCGGFDLYSAPLMLEQPCKGIKGKVLDKNTMEPLLTKSIIQIKEISAQKSFISSLTDLPRSEYLVDQLCTGKYNFHIEAAGYYAKDTLVEVNLQSDILVHSLTPLPEPEPQKVFDLREYNIPFFVTGYYKLNTKENLNILRSRINTDLASATYIENPGEKYDRYSAKIESIFKDSIYSFVSDSLLPFFKNIENEYLEFEVFGYTDPRKLSSTYIENNIEFDQVNVKKGSEINNKVLSNLRAYHTMMYLDEMLKSNADYLVHRKNGKISFKIQGMGVDTIKKDITKEVDYDARRRVQIKIWLRPVEF